MISSINHNMLALAAVRQTDINQKKNQKSMEKLSSGYRINRAADDAAGLSISEKMRYQVRGLNQASRNIQDGISLIQAADGAMAEISDIIHRIKELSIQAANGTYTPGDRESMQQEVDSLLREINSIHNKTYFNNTRVLAGGKGEAFIDGIGPGGVPLPPGYYIKGGLPQWIIQSSGTTSMGNLSDKTEIMSWKMVCTSITAQDGSAVTSFVTDAKSGYTYIAGNPVLQQDMFGLSQSVEGTDTLNKKDGQTEQVTITDANGQKYTASVRYEHISYKYASAFLDFSGVNAGNIKELAGNGFYSTCTHCDKRYSVEFVDKGGAGDGYNMVGIGHYTYTVDISGITNGNDLIKKIVNVLGDNRYFGKNHDKYQISGTGQYIHSAKPMGHLSDFAAEIDANGRPTGRLVIISTAYDRGSFVSPFFPEYGLFNSGVFSYDPNLTQPGKPAETEKPKELHIQTGFRSGDAVVITLPSINCNTLNLSYLSVQTEQDAGRAMMMADYALAYLNNERSGLGAWQNRLEHAYANALQTAENTQAAESNIRDTDMADEIVKYQIQNILLQAGMSVLAQANQHPERMLRLLT